MKFHTKVNIRGNCPSCGQSFSIHIDKGVHRVVYNCAECNERLLTQSPKGKVAE